MQRSETLQQTIDIYEDHPEVYAATTPAVVGMLYRPFLDTFCTLVGSKSKVLEIGSATGRDARYLEDKDVSVLRSDVALSFVERLRKNGYTDTVEFDALKTNLHKTFVAVLAQAVLVHFTEDEFDIAIQNIKNHLEKGGYFAFSVKLGEGSGFSSHKFGKDRYFTYWQYHDVHTKLAQHGFTPMITFLPENAWIQVIAKMT